MSKTVPVMLALAVGLVVGISIGGWLMLPAEAQTATRSYSAVPGGIGAEDVSGPYEVVEGWPKDLSTLPGHEKWTYGGARGIFAESPNRVYLLGGGELPNIPRPQTKLLTDLGPNVLFPLAGLPWRNANTATPPGAGGSRQDPARGMELWRGSSPPYRADTTHFNRPTFIAWLPDGSFYVADGYNGTRVVKFDVNGKFLLDFGKPGDPGKETRPGYMNNVSGLPRREMLQDVFELFAAAAAQL